MNETIIDVSSIEPIARDSDASELGRGAYERLRDVLSSLSVDDWETQTECAPWTVADMVRHMVGAAKSHVSLRETFRQTRYGEKNAAAFGGSSLDATNELQVREHKDLDPSQLLGELHRLGDRAVQKRMRQPWFIRRISVPNPIAGNMPDGSPESIRLSHLFDAILTRDVWLHRIDIARAVGIDIGSDAFDRRIVEDVVAEWASRHGQPVTLRLTGEAGGTYRSGAGGPTIELDAIEFARVLSGRAASNHELTDTRVLF